MCFSIFSHKNTTTKRLRTVQLPRMDAFAVVDFYVLFRGRMFRNVHVFYVL